MYKLSWYIFFTHLKIENKYSVIHNYTNGGGVLAMFLLQRNTKRSRMYYYGILRYCKM